MKRICDARTANGGERVLPALSLAFPRTIHAMFQKIYRSLTGMPSRNLRNLAMEQRKSTARCCFVGSKWNRAMAQGKEIRDMDKQEKAYREMMDKVKNDCLLPQDEVCRRTGKDAQRGHTEYMKDLMEYQYEE